MKKRLLILNIAMIIPCLSTVIGVLSLEFIFLLVVAVSIVNTCLANSKKNLIIYNSVLFICLAAGIFSSYCERKNYGVGFHPGVTEEYQLIMAYHMGCAVIVTVFELVLNHFLNKKKDDS